MRVGLRFPILILQDRGPLPEMNHRETLTPLIAAVAVGYPKTIPMDLGDLAVASLQFIWMTPWRVQWKMRSRVYPLGNRRNLQLT